MARGRPYCKVGPRLHTGSFGRSIRGEGIRELRAQSIASYLTSCPHGNAIGLFFLPVGYIIADRGWSQDGAYDALSIVEERGLIRWVPETEWVWVIEFFRHEMGADPDRSHGDSRKDDSRITLIRGLLTEAEGSGLRSAFLAHHGPNYPYLLGSIDAPSDAPSDAPPDAPSDAPPDAPSDAPIARARARSGAGAGAGAGGRDARAREANPQIHKDVKIPPALLKQWPGGRFEEMWRQRLRITMLPPAQQNMQLEELDRWLADGVQAQAIEDQIATAAMGGWQTIGSRPRGNGKPWSRRRRGGGRDVLPEDAKVYDAIVRAKPGGVE